MLSEHNLNALRRYARQQVPEETIDEYGISSHPWAEQHDTIIFEIVPLSPENDCHRLHSNLIAFPY